MAAKKINQVKIPFVLNVTARVVRALAIFGFAIFMILGAFCAGIGTGYFNSLVSKTKLPTKEEFNANINDISEVSKLQYSNGETIATIKSDLIRTIVESDKIAPIMKEAVISTEDENFMKHKGVVPKAFFRALLSEATGLGSASGGSTLTQQLVKQQILGDDPTLKRKANEILYALQIEKYFSKDEILTTYLNVSPFGRNNKGENIAGIEEAALGIFGVHASELNIAESAFLAGLPQSPIVYSPYLSDGTIKSDEDLALGLKRQKNVLFNMFREGYIKEKDYNEAKAFDLKAHFLPSGQATGETQGMQGFLYYAVLNQAQDILARLNASKDGLTDADMKDEKTYNSYLDGARKMLQRSGYTVTSTIDHGIYDAMQTAAADYGYLLDRGNEEGGTVESGNVLMDNATGAILGFVGGRDFNTNQNNHAFNTTRSPGSTIKPLLVYGPAIDNGLMGTASQVSNFPTKYPDGQYILHVGNKGTNRFMSVREALEYSWNIPAYDTYVLLRNKNIPANQYMEEMNYDIADYSIASLPMGGGVEVTTATQTNGYQTFASGGVYHESYLISKICDTRGNVVYEHKVEDKRIYSQATATIMQDLLRSVVNCGITTNYRAALSDIAPTLLDCDWVGKTGTTEDFRDAWLIVSTPRVTLSSWSGFDNNEPMTSTSGQNNSSYLACMASRIYGVSPEVFGFERFTLDSSVLHTSVSSFTGQKVGKVTVNGKEKNTPGTVVESLWAKNGPGASTYEFGIGGSKDDYKKAWENPDFKGTDPWARDG